MPWRKRNFGVIVWWWFPGQQSSLSHPSNFLSWSQQDKQLKDKMQWQKKLFGRKDADNGRKDTSESKGLVTNWKKRKFLMPKKLRVKMLKPWTLISLSQIFQFRQYEVHWEDRKMPLGELKNGLILPRKQDDLVHKWKQWEEKLSIGKKDMFSGVEESKLSKLVVDMAWQSKTYPKKKILLMISL